MNSAFAILRAVATAAATLAASGVLAAHDMLPTLQPLTVLGERTKR
jgi:hypothetical protein